MPASWGPTADFPADEPLSVAGGSPDQQSGAARTMTAVVERVDSGPVGGGEDEADIDVDDLEDNNLDDELVQRFEEQVYIDAFQDYLTTVAEL